MSHAFSSANLKGFEPFVSEHIRTLVRQLDDKAEHSVVKTANGIQTNTVDMVPWFNYLTFDVISDLAFGSSFSMVRNGSDLAEMRRTPDSKPEYVPFMGALAERALTNLYVAALPAWEYTQLLDPGMNKRSESAAKLVGVAYACVKHRVENPSEIDREDILSRLIAARDDNGEALGVSELTSDALTLIVAGSDTTANTLAMLMHYAVSTPGVLSKLQDEIDAAVPDDADVIPTHDMVRDLPYLDRVIRETLRVHSLLGLGLQRVQPVHAPEGGLTILGRYLPAGTVLSVPAYTMHHSKEIWGADADKFRPERWEELSQRQKTASIPWSVGPRACLGRNLAEMELKLVTATWVKRYAVETAQQEVGFMETFLRKPESVDVVLRRRSKGL